MAAIEPVVFLYGVGGVVALVVLTWVGLHLAMAISVWWAFRESRPPGSTEIKCRKCKYDLRASPEICPECGVKPTRMQATFIRYLMRIDKLDDLEHRRKARGER